MLHIVLFDILQTFQQWKKFENR